MIPKLHYISQGSSSKEHLENIQNACNSGIELVQLGIKKSTEKEFLLLAQEAREITSHFQTRLVITNHFKIAKTIKADGIYLEKIAPCPTVARKQLYTWQWISGEATTLQDCEVLIAKDVDYIYLTPFKATHKNQILPALGIHGYTAITEALQTKTPIIGEGGITTEDVIAILETGISGIAVSGEITRDFNTIRTFHQLLKASSTEEQHHTFK